MSGVRRRIEGGREYVWQPQLGQWQATGKSTTCHPMRTNGVRHMYHADGCTCPKDEPTPESGT